MSRLKLLNDHKEEDPNFMNINVFYINNVNFD